MISTARTHFLALGLSVILYAEDGRPASTVESYLLDASFSFQSAYSLPVTKTASGETIDEHRARRARIVADVWAAVNDPSTPALFVGPNARIDTALFVLGIWKEESNFNLRVDKQHCAELPKGSCDNGSAWCMGQIHPKDVALGWSGEELQADNVKCAKATIVRLAMAKAGTPKDAPAADRFCGYAIGHFETPCPPMRLRYGHAARWRANHAP